MAIMALINQTYWHQIWFCTSDPNLISYWPVSFQHLLKKKKNLHITSSVNIPRSFRWNQNIPNKLVLGQMCSFR